MSNNKQVTGVRELSIGDPIVLAPKYMNCDDKIACLSSRIGCQEKHLLDGSLTYTGDEGDQILVGRPLKAGNILVARKFFVLYVPESSPALANA